MSRILTEERRAQGFTSQGQLDAHWRLWDHTATCPVCSRVAGAMPLDDGMQPYMDQCEEGARLDRARFGTQEVLS